VGGFQGGEARAGQAMFKKNLFLKVAGPTVMVSVVLTGLGTAAAVFLYRQQAASLQVLDEDVQSRKIASDLQSAVGELMAALGRDDHDKVASLHHRIQDLIQEAWEFSDKEEEARLVRQADASFGRYHRMWEAASGPDRKALVAVLQEETLPACRKLRSFNARQIEKSEQALLRTMTWIGWGLAGVGVTASLAGIFLGYGVARGLRRSIYQLSVRIRDAAGKLGQDLPAVVLTRDGDLRGMQEQMRGVVREIEQVVDKLQQREREVLRAEQLAAVGQLAAGVAHELRNPLTSINMLVQINREEAEARGLSAPDLAIIEQEVRRMQRCLQTFLDFARPPRPERRPLDLASAVERTFALVAGRAQNQGVQLTFLPPESPPAVEADAEQIHQLLVNLTLNALDAMPLGGTLAVELRGPEDGQVELLVSDTGPGIAPEVLPRLFEPFVTTKETGLGLGLVVSRRIAEGHGGSLRACNRPGGGACFVLRLPTQRDEG
jgi:signal transduction histidine kinase